MKKILLFFISIVSMLFAVDANAAVTITKSAGWYESAYAEWAIEAGATYEVYVKATSATQWTKLDNELVRKYPTYGRADALGLKAGSYEMKVVSSLGGEATTSALTVRNYDRAGFAHAGGRSVGAYNNDGTLKNNAVVIYLNGNNASTVTAKINAGNKVDADGNLSSTGTVGPQKATGIQAILALLEKGKETRPIAIRIVGTVKKADLDAMNSNEGLQVKGKGGVDAQLTIEGVGEDATVHGFGFLVRSMVGVEFRNYGIMICLDDCLSLDTDNHYIWIHNMDFFYGGTGSDSDQAKGDGTVDVKGKSSHVTLAYNHFFDTGKSSLGGMKSETTSCVLTYHHNWFDHSDSRHPRIRTMSFHIYNNYFDGNAKYGVGMTMGGSAFVEKNYFRNVKYPMLISKQGTDATGDGTFSGEAGGVIKSFDNYIFNPRRFFIHKFSTGNGVDHNGDKPYSRSAEDDGDWDAYEVASATEEVPNTIVSASDSTKYNNFAIDYSYTPDAAADVKTIVTDRTWGAGRMNGGDFQWQFDNSTEDTNYGVNTRLKQELIDYKSSLIGYFDGTTLANGGYTGGRSGGDSKKNEDYVVSYNGQSSDAPSDDEDEKLQEYLTNGAGDFYWFDASNDENTLELIAQNYIKLNTGSSYDKNKTATGDSKTGSLQLATSTGEAVFYCPSGIPFISFNLFRTGSLKGDIYYSDNGTSFTKQVSYSTKSSGAYTHSYSIKGTTTGEGEEEVTTYPKYVKITNTSGGSLHIHGVKIYTVEGGADAIMDITSTKVATPNISCVNNKVTITTSAGATIYYTTDGTEPTTSSTKYEAPFEITESCTVKALGVKVGKEDSDVATKSVVFAEIKPILSEVVFSNGFKAFIKQPGINSESQPYDGTVKAYYMEGTDVPTISSHTEEEGASYNYADNTITITKAGVSAVYNVTVEAVAPQTITDKITFNGSESWIKTGNAFNAEKGWVISKAVEDVTNRRVSEGKARIYLFVGPAASVKINNEKVTSDRAVKVSVNGVLQSSVTSIPKATSGSITVTTSEAAPSMIEIISNQTAGDAGISSIELGTTTGGGGTGGGDTGGDTGGGDTGGGGTGGGTGTIPADGKVLIQSNSIPTGFAFDGSTTPTAYTYSSTLCTGAYLIMVNEGTHTITIPSNMKVTAAKLYAVCHNNTANKGKITALAGKTFDISLNSRQDASFSIAEATGLSITGSLTFNVTYASGVKLELQVEEVSTGINDVQTSATQNQKHDILGRRLTKAAKGQLYIMNGKKYIAK